MSVHIVTIIIIIIIIIFIIIIIIIIIWERVLNCYGPATVREGGGGGRRARGEYDGASAFHEIIRVCKVLKKKVQAWKPEEYMMACAEG